MFKIELLDQAELNRKYFEEGVATDSVIGTTGEFEESTVEYRKSRFSISESSHTACNRGVMTYFGREKSRTKEEILARQVICLKKDRGVPGSRERSRHHQSATAPLAQKFGAAGHWVVQNRDGESDSQNYSNLQSAHAGNLAKVGLLDLQSVYIRNIAKVGLLEKRVNEYDMKSVWMI